MPMNFTRVIMGPPCWFRPTLRQRPRVYKDRTGCYSIGCHSMTATFRLDQYVADVLMRDLIAHDRSPAAFLVYFYLAAQGRGARPGKVSVSLADLADRTGLSKRAVQLALSHLRRRHLIKTTQVHRTATPVHVVAQPWRAR